MKTKKLVENFLNAFENDKPTRFTYKGKVINITKKIINEYKDKLIKDDVEENYDKIDKTAKEGGILPLLPLIFAGIGAAASTAGGTAGIVKAVNDKKAADLEQKETGRHNKEKEKAAKGSGSLIAAGNSLGAVGSAKGSGVADASKAGLGNGVADI